MINSVKGVTAWAVDPKGNYVYDANGHHVSVQKTPDKILVSGIIGWPPDPNTISSNVQTSDQYQIGIDTTALPVPQNTYWDYMPICSVPSITARDGNIYKAYGGLRLKRFLDALQRTDAQGRSVQNTFSICNSDFTPAMTAIANAIAQVLKPGCVPYPLVDTDPSTPDIQPECQAVDRIPCDTPGTPPCLLSGYEEYPRAECIDPTTGLPLDPTNPQVGDVPDSVRPCWYLYNDPDPNTGCPDTYQHQRITVLRKTGEIAPPGTMLAMKCLTCPGSDPECALQSQ
jgi:hypothetical protein